MTRSSQLLLTLLIAFSANCQKPKPIKPNGPFEQIPTEPLSTVIIANNGDTLKSESPLEISLAANGKEFSNYAAINRLQALELSMNLRNRLSCSASIQCSRGEDLWTTCPLTTGLQLVLPQREILAGFQRLLVRAQCDDAVSNTLELTWFGVSPAYAPLSLEKRDIGSYSHFRLERSADCAGKLSFSCRDSADKPFADCSNLRADAPRGFEIKTSCLVSSGKVEGPVFRND